MINQLNQNYHTQNKFSDAIKELQIGKLMRKYNITISCGISAYEVFQFTVSISGKEPLSLPEFQA